MIKKIEENKKSFLSLLLLGDEQENMIEKYLERGEMYALYVGNEAASICVVTDEGGGVLEIKNMATAVELQGRGYARQLIEFVANEYKSTHDTLIVGTGDSPLTIPFYKRCGFVESHRVPNFFTDNYDHPIFEAGVQLIDMVYLKMSL